MYVVSVLHQPALQESQLVGIVFEDRYAHARMIMPRARRGETVRLPARARPLFCRETLSGHALQDLWGLDLA